MTTTIKTKFGNARVNAYGYYAISSTKEGNRDKLLHRLIFEDFYNIKLPSDILIHHDDENKLNNEIWNLIPMTKKEHHVLHHKNKKIPEELVEKRCISRNSTGYYRVLKQKDKTTSQGFIWRYSYHDNNGKKKRLSSVDINTLKEKVLSMGLPWSRLNET